MTPSRTVRIDEEMVERALDTQGRIGPVRDWLYPETMRKALEAALGPYLERRKGERRVNESLHQPTQPKAEVPTGDGAEKVNVLDRFHRRLGDAQGMWTPHYRGPMQKDRTTQTHHARGNEATWKYHRRASDHNAKAMTSGDTGTGQAGQKQNAEPEIHVSEEMKNLVARRLFDKAHPEAIDQFMSLYKELYLQSLKEQGK
jgi:hypothetical protein